MLRYNRRSLRLLPGSSEYRESGRFCYSLVGGAQCAPQLCMQITHTAKMPVKCKLEIPQQDTLLRARPHALYHSRTSLRVPRLQNCSAIVLSMSMSEKIGSKAEPGNPPMQDRLNCHCDYSMLMHKQACS